jgi:hypothetical protein
LQVEAPSGFYLLRIGLEFTRPVYYLLNRKIIQREG